MHFVDALAHLTDQRPGCHVNRIRAERLIKATMKDEWKHTTYFVVLHVKNYLKDCFEEKQMCVGKYSGASAGNDLDAAVRG